MKNREVIEAILAYHPQFPPEYAGCDDYKCGDPEAECTGVVVAMSPTSTGRSSSLGVLISIIIHSIEKGAANRGSLF